MQASNQLSHFDGSRFSTVRQTGHIPLPRGYHLSTTFGGKYLILFAGNNQQQFFNDWYLFNTKTFEWKQLCPSIDVPCCSGGSMLWLGGRGLLLLNDTYDS